MTPLNETSTLYKKLKAGEFVITAELSPPKVPDLSRIDKHLEHYRQGVDAINVLDMPSATLRMSSLGTAIYVKQQGLEPVLQMTCRDRSKLGMQADLISAYAHGIRNVLCLTGDYVTFGDHPMSKPVYDMDSTNAIMMVNQLRRMGKAYGGGAIADSAKEEPFKMQWCIGGAANPAGNKPEHLARHMAKKVAAGVDFLQTQPVYDLDVFDKWWKALEREGVTKNTAILPGILPPRSYKGLEFMMQHVPGIWVPPQVAKRIQQAQDQKQEALDLALETMRTIKERYPIAGFHLYPLAWTENVPYILKELGLLSREQTPVAAAS
ncbi:MAG: methylenetetrahydrofolate reductase [Pseudomonadales bacterium]|nr:methylenetetrahydrofolate reductase [Pseudomonadales bacterium]